jgi:hypothetical protein
MTFPYKSFVTFSQKAVALVIFAGMPLSAQIFAGTRNPPPAGDQSQRIAAAKAEFASVLLEALSPASIQAMLARVKEMPAGNVAGLTTFDNVVAPCAFIGTTALRGPEQYAEFQAPGNNGGAILNVCSDFGVKAHSAPNFLAFNNTSLDDDNGVPKLPELIGVGRQRTSVSLWISGGLTPGFPIAIAALGSAGVVGIVHTTTTTAWAQVTIAGPGIDAIVLIGNPHQLVVDDIQSE